MAAMIFKFYKQLGLLNSKLLENPTGILCISFISPFFFVQFQLLSFKNMIQQIFSSFISLSLSQFMSVHFNDFFDFFMIVNNLIDWSFLVFLIEFCNDLFHKLNLFFNQSLSLTVIILFI